MSTKLLSETSFDRESNQSVVFSPLSFICTCKKWHLHHIRPRVIVSSLSSKAERKEAKMDKTYKTYVQFTRTQLRELSTVTAKTQLNRSELVRREVDHYFRDQETGQTTFSELVTNANERRGGRRKVGLHVLPSTYLNTQESRRLSPPASATRRETQPNKGRLAGLEPATF